MLYIFSLGVRLCHHLSSTNQNQKAIKNGNKNRNIISVHLVSNFAQPLIPFKKKNRVSSWLDLIICSSPTRLISAFFMFIFALSFGL